MRESIGKVIEKIAEIAADSASLAFFYEPELPAELLKNEKCIDNSEQKEQ